MNKPAKPKRLTRAIDWEQIKSKLLAETAFDYSERDLENIFAQRADALARSALQHQHKREATHLACKLGTISMLLPLPHVLRIMAARRTARVPGAPSSLAQLMHVDGKLVAIADLRGALDLTSAPSEKQNVVLLGEGARRLALLVDGLTGLVTLDERSISPATTHARVGADFVTGLSPDLALVIDTHRLIHGLKASADPSTPSKGAAI